MAKRVSPTEKPFNPVEQALTRSVLQPEIPSTQTTSTHPDGDEHPAPALATPKVVNIDEARREQRSAEEDRPQRKKQGDSKKLTQARRFLLTDEEDNVLEQLVIDMGRRMETSLTVSHLLRATATLLLQAREDLLKQSEKMKGLKRPSNNDQAALVSFEHNITRLIDRAIRNSRIEE